MALSDGELYKLIEQLEYLKPTDLKKAKATAEAEHIPLYESLLKHDVLPDENLGKIIADSLKLPFVRLGQEQISDQILSLVPEDIAEKYQTIAFELESDILKIGTNDPTS